MNESRSFLVHLEDDARHCRAIAGVSFEEAAVIFVEDLHLEEDEVAVTVIDVRDGRRQCFRIDAGNPESAPCG